MAAGDARRHGRDGIRPLSSDTLFNAVIQRNVPQALLGRVTSINFLIGSLFIPLSPLAAAAIIEVAGAAMSFVVAGVWAAGIALVLLFISPVRELR